jgi:hypothetical protein
LDYLVELGIPAKQGIKGQPSQETTRHRTDFVRKIGCSSLLMHLRKGCFRGTPT